MSLHPSVAHYVSLLRLISNQVQLSEQIQGRFPGKECGMTTICSYRSSR
jgi:hypothetical protein